MEPLGPWPPVGGRSPIAVAVSGGADSTALALLTARWTGDRRLPVLALVVDHGLRPEAAADADATRAFLAGIGIQTRLLRLHGLQTGPSLAERARVARYQALTEACMEAGAVDLLLGHHAGDQAETVLMRRRAGSGADGLAGMAGLVETAALRLLRPLLGIAPARLRYTVARVGIGWIEDPSNRDGRAQRTHLRRELAAAPTLGSALLLEARRHGHRRMRGEGDAATVLARSVELRPEGFALLPPELLPFQALAALIRSVGGASHQPPTAAIDRLLQRRRPCTLAGTRLLPAGRLGPGWLLVREVAALAGPVRARPGVIWDNRHRLLATADLPDGLEVGALGLARPPGPPSFLPAVVLATLPAIRRRGELVAVPHLGWDAGVVPGVPRFALQPPGPATGPGVFSAD